MGLLVFFGFRIKVQNDRTRRCRVRWGSFVRLLYKIFLHPLIVARENFASLLQEPFQMGALRVVPYLLFGRDDYEGIVWRNRAAGID